MVYLRVGEELSNKTGRVIVPMTGSPMLSRLAFHPRIRQGVREWTSNHGMKRRG